MVVLIAVCHLPEILFSLVTPPALAKAKGEFGWDVAPPDDPPELLDDVIGGIPLYHIQIQVRLLAGDLQHIRRRISDVEDDFGGVVHEQAEGLFPRHHDEIVGAVQGTGALQMVWVIRGVAHITVAPLVDPSDRLPQPINHGVLWKLVPVAEPILKADRSEGRTALCRFYVFHYGLRLEWMPVLIFPDHSVTLLSTRRRRYKISLP